MRMRYRPARADSVILSNQTAFALCDSLLQMTRFWIIELPEPELREIRNALDSLLVRTDQVLDLMEGEICLEFGSLRVDSNIRHPPGAEDFGAVVIPSTVASDTNDTAESDIGEQESLDSDVSEADVGEFHSTFSSRCPGAANQISVPAAALPPAPASTPVRSPTPAPEPAPTALKYHGRHPLIVSSRENVGLPDYAYHPHFVRPGVPGTYLCPPAPYGNASSGLYIAITKGLYVGIFTNWEEVAPWVLGVSGSKYRKSRSWENARDVYNARLAANAVEVLP